jgi:flagellar FliL protein
MKGGDEETQASVKESQKEESAIGMTHPLESFIVNLMDKAGLGKRYLKVKIMLEVGGEEDVRTVEQHTPQLRDNVLLQLSSRSFNDINTVEGKLELKQALLTGINQVLGESIVRRIYFTEFVVQ